MSGASISASKRLQYSLEYVPLRLAVALTDVLPLHMSESMIRGLSRLAFSRMHKRRGIAVDNILKAGIRSSVPDAEALALASFQHFSLLVFESLQSGRRFAAENWQDSIKVEMPPELHQIIHDPSQGLIMTSGHFGNWEIAGQLLSTIKPVNGVSRPMKNPYVERLLQKRKPRHQFRMTPKHDMDMTRFLATLKQGEVLALMIDTHAPDDRAMRINFLGRPASTYTAVALLHLVTRVPMCFGWCVRKGLMDYEMAAAGPFVHDRTGNKMDDIEAILTLLTAELENVIRKYPEQYLWAHRRWKISDG
jgi:KDO2-lipid IV(A) lauroyltransferase